MDKHLVKAVDIERTPAVVAGSSDYAADIPADLARRAHAGTSFDPEKRGEQVRRDYAIQLERDRGALDELADTSEKRAILDDEFLRYRQGYQRRYLAWLTVRTRAVSTMIAGPSKFPVRKQQKVNASEDKRLNELLEYRKRAFAVIKKRLTPELQPIRLGDADAGERVVDKLEGLKREREQMMQANKIIRGGGKSAEIKVEKLVSLGYPEKIARELLKPDAFGRPGFPDYKIKNTYAETKRLEARLAQVEQVKSAIIEESRHEGLTLEINPGENRVRLKFQGKPRADVIANLKRHAFRWTPSLGVWQAYVNAASVEFAKSIAAGADRAAGVTGSSVTGPAPADVTPAFSEPPLDRFAEAERIAGPGNWTPLVDLYAHESRRPVLSAWLDKYATNGRDARALLDGRDYAPEAGIRPDALDEIARRLHFAPITPAPTTPLYVVVITGGGEMRRVGDPYRSREAADAFARSQASVFPSWKSATVWTFEDGHPKLSLGEDHSFSKPVESEHAKHARCVCQRGSFCDVGHDPVLCEAENCRAFAERNMERAPAVTSTSAAVTPPAVTKAKPEKTKPEKAVKHPPHLHTPKLVKASTIERASGAKVPVKRDCITGVFVPRRARANDCKAEKKTAKPPWTLTTQHAPPGKPRVCWATRRDALLAFKDANQNVIDAAGGLTRKQETSGAWDAVTEKYGGRIKNLGDAINACLPKQKPYCLDRFDLDCLNETQAAMEAGGFRLPDFVEEQKLLEKQNREAESIAEEIRGMIAEEEEPAPKARRGEIAEHEGADEEAIEEEVHAGSAEPTLEDLLSEMESPSGAWQGQPGDVARVLAQAGRAAASTYLPNELAAGWRRAIAKANGEQDPEALISTVAGLEEELGQIEGTGPIRRMLTRAVDALATYLTEGDY